MKTYPFSALLSRMKYITRWCLMRSTRAESLVSTPPTRRCWRTLCLIGRHCTGTGAALRPEVVATAAIYHDAPEILTGDMPTPSSTRTTPCAQRTRPWRTKRPRDGELAARRIAGRNAGLADRQSAE